MHRINSHSICFTHLPNKSLEFYIQSIDIPTTDHAVVPKLHILVPVRNCLNGLNLSDPGQVDYRQPLPRT